MKCMFDTSKEVTKGRVMTLSLDTGRHWHAHEEVTIWTKSMPNCRIRGLLEKRHNLSKSLEYEAGLQAARSLGVTKGHSHNLEREAKSAFVSWNYSICNIIHIAFRDAYSIPWHATSRPCKTFRVQSGDSWFHFWGHGENRRPRYAAVTFGWTKAPKSS